MSGRSPSGVASLRARFEQNRESSGSSPPSRGRSPADLESTGGDSSRPLSKVRTSFVAVEPSGRMATQLEEGKDSGFPAVAPSGDGSIESETAGVNESLPQDKVNGEMAVGSEKIEGPTTNHSDANRDKPVSAAEEISSGMLPSDPKDESAITGGDGASEYTPGLGSILKGSPFEKEDVKLYPRPPNAPKLASTKPAPGHASQSANPIAKGNKTNAYTTSSTGKPDVSSAAKPVNKAPRSSAVDGKPGAAFGKEPQAKKDTTNEHVRDLEAQKAQHIVPVSAQGQRQTQSSKAASSFDDDSKSVHDGNTNGINHVQGQSTQPARKDRQHPFQTSHPTKLAMQKEAQKPIKKAIGESKEPVTKHPGRPSDANKTPVASKSSTAKPSTDLSSPPGFKKPMPKPPTRPVKLPTSATAPTTASAAKVDESPAPSRSPSRASTSSTAKKGSLSSQPKTRPDHVRPRQLHSVSKPARASLPAGSKPTEKPKAKPRMSMASAKAPEGSFLDRMMRPTQSSASKTHEKVEAKTPPRKVSGVKPKRKSDDVVKDKSNDQAEATDLAEVDGETADRTQVEQSKLEQSSANGPADSQIPAVGESA